MTAPPPHSSIVIVIEDNTTLGCSHSCLSPNVYVKQCSFRLNSPLLISHPLKGYIIEAYFLYQLQKSFLTIYWTCYVWCLSFLLSNIDLGQSGYVLNWLACHLKYRDRFFFFILSNFFFLFKQCLNARLIMVVLILFFFDSAKVLCFCCDAFCCK